MSLSPHQSEQLAIALSAKVGILTGSAGTGKSHTVQQYLHTLEPGSFIVLTPTGKAAQRINDETAYGARTIHSALKTRRNGHDGEGWHFFYGRSNPLPVKTIVVDEAFMLSTDIMAALFRAAAKGTRILLVGDPNQLSPVGHGCPAWDMLRSGVVPHGHLSEVWRYAGRIANTANAIKNGDPWQPSRVLDPSAEVPENYKHAECRSPSLMIKALPALMERLADRGYDLMDDVQVICWLNDKGPLARHALNRHLQAILNPDGEQADESLRIPFRLGDKIICTQNHFRNVMTTHVSGDDQDDETYIANGEIGRVLNWSFNNHRINGIVARFGGHKVIIAKEGPLGLRLFDPAYAVTCHKYQGAQAKVIVVVADDSADRVASRQGIYTAFTRASEVLISIGRMATLKRQCLRLDIARRKTFLTELLREHHRELSFADSDLMEI